MLREAVAAVPPPAPPAPAAPPPAPAPVAEAPAPAAPPPEKKEPASAGGAVGVLGEVMPENVAKWIGDMVVEAPGATDGDATIGNWLPPNSPSDEEKAARVNLLLLLHSRCRS